MQDFTLKDLLVGDFKDHHQNTWCRATFAEHGEPVIWVLKDPSKATIGQTYYGEIQDWTSAKGTTSPRFYKRERPEAGEAPTSQPTLNLPDKPKDSYEPGTNARWAIKMSFDAYVRVMGSPPDPETEPHSWGAIEATAQNLLSMFDKLKNSGSGVASNPLSTPTPTIKEPENKPFLAATAPESPGLAKAREMADRLKGKATLTADEANKLLDDFNKQIPPPGDEDFPGFDNDAN